MRFHFTTIPVFGDGSAQTELNHFLAGHKVIGVDRQLVDAGQGSAAWAVCVQYVDGAELTTAKKPTRIDYREVLPEDEFAMFSELRMLRRLLAEQEGVPLYSVFNNEQLAEMVQKRARTIADLGAIDGVGKQRIDKYGQRFLERLRPFCDGTPGGSPSGNGRGQA